MVNLGPDHLTLEGGGGGDFWATRIFFFEQSGGQDIFLFPISSLLHLCCMQFFSSDKRLQEIFFKITHPKPVKNKKKPVFLIYSSRFLDGFERLSAEATFRTPAHTAKM